jgi:hypothetical protein
MDRFRKYLVVWLICDDRPFVTVESEHLRRIFRLLMPHISTPSADTIKNVAMSTFITKKKGSKHFAGRYLVCVMVVVVFVLFFRRVALAVGLRSVLV